MKAEPSSILRRLKIASGQVDGLVRMVEEDRYCIDISNQIMAVISALKGVNRDILTAHLSHCVLSAYDSSDPDQVKKKLEEMEEVIQKLSK